jgi:hypothetical protein
MTLDELIEQLQHLRSMSHGQVSVTLVKQSDTWNRERHVQHVEVTDVRLRLGHKSPTNRDAELMVVIGDGTL